MSAPDSYPFQLIRANVLCVSSTQLSRIMDSSPADLKSWERKGGELNEMAVARLKVLHRVGSLALAGVEEAEKELELLGEGIRGLDDLPDENQPDALKGIYSHIDRMRELPNRTDDEISDKQKRSNAEPEDIVGSDQYSEVEDDGYGRVLIQLARGGPNLRQQVGMFLGSSVDCQNGVESARDLICAHWWSLQAWGNSWAESLTPYNNVNYNDLLYRIVSEFGTKRRATGGSISIPQLERCAAEAFSEQAISSIKKADSELFESLQEFASELDIPTPENWSHESQEPLAVDSPIRLLAALNAGKWAEGLNAEQQARYVKATEAWSKTAATLSREIGRHAGKVIKAVNGNLVALAIAVGGTAVAVSGFWICRQDLERVGKALTLIHLAELGIL